LNPGLGTYDTIQYVLLPFTKKLVSLSLSLTVSEIQGLIFHRKKKQICLDQNSEDAVANERQTGNWTFQRTLATLHPSLHRFAEQ
jgi:hypothetical protein